MIRSVCYRNNSTSTILILCKNRFRSTFAGSEVSSIHPNQSTKTVSSPIDFTDTKLSYGTKSFFHLVRSRLVFSLCRVNALTSHAETLINLSYRILGKSITNTALRLSFFGHFCAGESELTISPTVKYLESNGIGSILDYAAESDVSEPKKTITEVVLQNPETVSIFILCF